MQGYPHDIIAARTVRCYALSACREREDCSNRAAPNGSSQKYPSFRPCGRHGRYFWGEHQGTAPFFFRNCHPMKDKRALAVRVVVIAVIVFVVGAIAYKKWSERTSGPDARVGLAQCLTQKGVKFYGAYWCPHCAKQKQAFGSKAMEEVTYVECAIPGDSNNQTQACKDQNITGYPTWTFPDGSRESGEQRLEDLASKAGCEYKPSGT